MLIKSAWFSFNPGMKVWVIAILCALQIQAAFAQEKPLEGNIFEKETNERIAKVNILNTRNNASYYNNLKAEFKITAQKGDKLIFSKTGYLNDTLTVGADNSVVIYLKRTSIVLNEVPIKGVFTPQQRLAATKRDYTKIYGSIADKDLLTSGGTGSGAGLSIDALYNMLSFSGRNATRLRAIIDRDYRENVIDYRFNRTLVSAATGLTEPKLTDFMLKYRPGYYFVLGASDYDLIKYINSSYKRYLRDPDAYSLQPLRP